MASFSAREDQILAQVRIKQQGKVVFSESKLFPDRKLAEGWAHRLEAKIKKEGLPTVSELPNLTLAGSCAYISTTNAMTLRVDLERERAAKDVALERAAFGLRPNAAKSQTRLDAQREGERNLRATADDRVERLTEALVASITGWRFEPVAGALQALRGVAAITAIGLVAEIGDLGRFAHPRKLMGYLGFDSVRTFQWRAHKPRQDHQDGQRPCKKAFDRGGLELSVRTSDRAAGRRPSRRSNVKVV